LLRFKKIIKKANGAVRELLLDLMAKIAVESVKASASDSFPAQRADARLRDRLALNLTSDLGLSCADPDRRRSYVKEENAQPDGAQNLGPTSRSYGRRATCAMPRSG
jgi:hypothetical protein